MAIFYNEGENKVRPGVYQRQVNIGQNALSSARDGICAIPIKAHWGPLGKVLKHTELKSLERSYGTGEYGEGYTVPAAAAMFRGGAQTVYTYRLGSGGTKAQWTMGAVTFLRAKYPGTFPISVSTQLKLGDNSTEQLLVYANGTLVETFEFPRGSEEAEGEGRTTGSNMAEAILAAGSNYIEITEQTAQAQIVPVNKNAVLTGGEDPTVTVADYSAAFGALESGYYNTIALDVADDAELSLSKMLQTYLEGAYQAGKLGIAVVGEKTTVAFETRLAHARAFNDAKIVYLGGGWMNGREDWDGPLAVCYTAGVIASTPANKGITHKTVSGATDLKESLTFGQYEDAIRSGMLMVSLSPDGTIWYDSAINTLVTPSVDTQDDGWKKIRRVKTRFELIDRLDRELQPKVGRIPCDSDGVADVIQTGQRVLDAMSNNEGKLMPGATFIEDPDNPHSGDSAWFVIQADDIDSLEKIYLQYQFRYSQNA